MKLSKLILTTTFSFLIIIATQAQNSSAILRTGVNIANVTTTNDGSIDKANSLTSFQVGLIGDIHLASILYFQPGLVFTGKGSKTQSGNTSDATNFLALHLAVKKILIGQMMILLVLTMKKVPVTES